MMNIDQIKKDIPNYGNKIFLNSAGASLMPHSVVKKIEAYLHLEEKFGGYEVEEMQKAAIQEFYNQAAQLIGAKAHNIAFTHDATDAFSKALSSIPFSKGDKILTTDDDYASNHIQFLSLKKRFGIEIHRMSKLSNGDLDIPHFQSLINTLMPNLVAVSHIPTNSGLIQDVYKIGEICNKHDVLYLVDACQSIGQIKVNVNQLKCDFLSTTGRKFLRGPRGTGFLYVSDKVLKNGYEPLFIDGRGATWKGIEEYLPQQTARRFETWESPYALVIGLTEALQYYQKIGVEEIESYNQKLMSRLQENLSQIPAVKVYDKGSLQGSILTFRKSNVDLETTTQKLKDNDIYFSVSSLEWGVIDFQEKGVDWLIRLSPHYFNTFNEIDKVSEIIASL
jgi:selenocysteine lyase/cysteine desulfurase